eukprot:m.1197019 g.1197019  ORF g.1197019 m.1197019 type:complete len:57 (-) comp24565_c0_seq1:124-294(-)
MDPEAQPLDSADVIKFWRDWEWLEVNFVKCRASARACIDIKAMPLLTKKIRSTSQR